MNLSKQRTSLNKFDFMRSSLTLLQHRIRHLALSAFIFIFPSKVFGNKICLKPIKMLLKWCHLSLLSRRYHVWILRNVLYPSAAEHSEPSKESEMGLLINITCHSSYTFHRRCLRGSWIHLWPVLMQAVTTFSTIHE